MQIDGGFIIAALGFIASLASVLFVYLKGRGENKIAEANAKTALDARIDARVEEQLTAAWTEIEKLKQSVKDLSTNQSRRDGAITRILRSLAKQWPTPDGPDLDPADIAIIEETVPAEWIRPKKREPKT